MSLSLHELRAYLHVWFLLLQVEIRAIYSVKWETAYFQKEQ